MKFIVVFTIILLYSIYACKTKEPTVLLVIPESCFEKFKNFDFDFSCLPKIISNGLSLGILLFSFIFKVP